MHSSCILDSVANLLVRHMVFVGKVQKSPIDLISRAWILLSISAVKVQLSQAYRKVDKVSVRISLTLEASEMFLSLHMIFSLERASVVWAILERISDFDPSLEMIAPRYLKLSTSSSLWPFILISWSLEAIRVVCHHFCLVWTDLHFVPCGGSIKTVYQDASLFFFFCIYDNFICKAKVDNESSPDADTTFVVIQSLTHDSL